MKVMRIAAVGVAVLFSAAAGAVNHNVTVGGASNSYSPNVLTVSVGDTVTFTNAGGFHNVMSGPGSVQAFRCANGCDGVGNGDPSGKNWVSVVTFSEVGSVPFLCEVHGQGMSGTITVVPVPVILQSFDID